MADKRLAFIFLTIFLDALGFAILIPIVPLLLADPSSTFYILPEGVPVESGYVLLGLITAIFPLMTFFSTSVLGQLSDKFGRKNILTYTIFLTAFSYALFAFGISIRSIPLLFFSRALAGIASGNLSVSQAAIADITEPKDRAKSFALIGAAYGLGFILGPFIGGKLSDPSILPFFDPTIPFYFAGAMSLINGFSVMRFFSETNKFRVEHPKLHWGKSLGNILKAFQLENLRSLYFTNFLFFSGFTFFVTFFSVFLIKRFAFTQGNIGDMFSFLGVCVLITQLVIVRKVAKRFDEKKVLSVALVADGTAVGLLYLSQSPWMVYGAVAIIAVFNGLIFANMAGLISRSADQKIQGEILGISWSVQALAQLLPPILSGFIAASFTPETPTLVAAIMMLSSGAFFLLFYRPAKEVAHIKGY